MPENLDNLLTSGSNCKRLQKLVEQVLKSDEVNRLNEKYKNLYDYLSENTGEQIANMGDIGHIYDTLFIESLYNKTLPEWTNKVFPSQMQYMTDLSFILTTWTHEMKRLAAGPLIDNIVNTFLDVANGSYVPNSRKMMMYSAHDSTLASLLNALDIFDPVTSPPYASMIMFELDTNDHVDIFYRNDTTKDPFALIIPGCQRKCPLDKFDRLTMKLRPKNWDKECRNGPDEIAALVTKLSIFIFILLLITLIAALCIYIRRSRNDDQIRYQALSQDNQDAWVIKKQKK